VEQDVEQKMLFLKKRTTAAAKANQGHCLGLRFSCCFWLHQEPVGTNRLGNFLDCLLTQVLITQGKPALDMLKGCVNCVIWGRS
jgi:hypothetical protein